MNKKVVFGLTALAIAGVGVGSTFSPQVRQWLEERSIAQMEKERYNHALERLMPTVHFKDGATSEEVTWLLDIADPRTAPLTQWNTPGDKPQIITQIHLAENRETAGLFTMNLDGSNLQTLLTPEEVGGLVGFTKNLRPQRSPNGRFLFFNMGLFVPLKGCAVADLKTRQIERFGGDCNFGGWLPDSSKAYMSKLGKAYEFDTNSMVMSELPLALPNPDSPELRKKWLDGNEHAYDKPIRVQLLNQGKQLLVTARTSHNKIVLGRADEETNLIYQVGEWQHYTVERYYPKECYLAEERRKYNAVAEYIYWREDGGAFTCNTKDGYRAFNTQDMSESTPLVGDSRYALQIGVFSGKESILTRLNRARQAEEISPIDELTYQYRTPLKGDRVSGFSLYVPASLQPDFNDYDLRQEFPALPDHAQYKQAFARYQEAQQEKCKEIDYGQWTSLEIRRCKRTCQIEKQGNIFVTTHCDSNQVK
ncbi:TPA: hypothetical protein I7787_17920 [Vibrio vulnificus]|uniref:hypothetical protein n=1 Tax=Vibrio vulnificus TaxID=672 RepID=UPI0010292181|nr:hypothetical protein [Vibrio vulnificus]EGR0204975.1 hypothetical protein [Vibrio vulnificus]EHU9442637.1 hypothetical protein [Vibrio vulnificus]EJX1088811.1 hypothetical protein [Vibrio vulnificus]ELH3488469.1 hypothetical protein [Vibrio vulnificus]MCU8500612.1 hypothetical protein [Vibrio vulnificus]